MKVIIFNVEHGFCAFVLSPNGYALMIDCGRTSTYSPVIDHILRYENDKIVPFEGQKLAELVISHPHDDHVEDISNIIEHFAPRLLKRQDGFNWSDLKEPDGDYENLDMYAGWQAKYSHKATTFPEWGMELFTEVSLSIDEAKALGETDYVNNTSIPVIIQCGGLKIVFPGDLMQTGWDALLKNDKFKGMLAGTTVFVASHHGHTSGFSTAAFDATGKPKINIVSAHHRDESVDSRYSGAAFAEGIDFGGDTRRMFSTRSDGSMVISHDSSIGWYIWTQKGEKLGKLGIGD